MSSSTALKRSTGVSVGTEPASKKPRREGAVSISPEYDGDEDTQLDAPVQREPLSGRSDLYLDTVSF